MVRNDQFGRQRDTHLLPGVKRVRVSVSVGVRVRCFVVFGGHKWVLYSSVAEGGVRGSASGSWLEGELCSMLTVMLSGDWDVAARV